MAYAGSVYRVRFWGDVTQRIFDCKFPSNAAPLRFKRNKLGYVQTVSRSLSECSPDDPKPNDNPYQEQQPQTENSRKN